MSSMTQSPGIPASRNGYRAPGADIPAIRNTRYLSAAAHLRRSMLPNEVTDPVTGTSRPPLPVGRAYAIQVLFRHGSRIPMLAVDMDMVKGNCWIALVQTTVRDMTAIGALAAGLIIEPWGMITTLAIVVAAVMLTRRSRLFLALIILGVVCVALALVNGNTNERISLGTPLACLAWCLLAYLADVWLSMYYVRRIWRSSARQEKSLAALRSSPVEGAPPAKSRFRPWPHAGSFRNSGNYAADEIVGAGASLRPLALTVPLDKPQEASRDIDTFSVSELMTELSSHLLSQGVGDAGVHGWAYQPLSPNGAGHGPREPGHFTFGLPHLDVTEVMATPAPDKDRWLGTPLPSGGLTIAAHRTMTCLAWPTARRPWIRSGITFGS